MNKKVVFVLIILVLIIAASLIFFLNHKSPSKGYDKKCEIDEDCSGSCGKIDCFNKNTISIQGDVCKLISCGCVNNMCTKQ